jgi:predicted PurR-regulated permease PerM
VVVLPRTLVILLELAAAVVIVAGIQAAAWLVGPVLLALVIVITVHPVQARLRAWACPPGVDDVAGARGVRRPPGAGRVVVVSIAR